MSKPVGCVNMSPSYHIDVAVIQAMRKANAADAALVISDSFLLSGSMSDLTLAM